MRRPPTRSPNPPTGVPNIAYETVNAPRTQPHCSGSRCRSFWIRTEAKVMQTRSRYVIAANSNRPNKTPWRRRIVSRLFHSRSGAIAAALIPRCLRLAANCANGLQAKAPAGFLEHIGGPCCAAASDTEGANLEQCVQVADSARCFHLDMRRGVLSHQGQVLECRAAGAIARRGFHPIGVEVRTVLAQPDLLLVIEIAVFENHFHFHPPIVGDLNHRSDVFAHVSPIEAEDLANVDYHIELFAAIGKSLFCLCDFNGSRVSAMREANGGRRFHGAARECLGTGPQIIGQNAYASNVVVTGELDALLEGGHRNGGIQQRMVDHFRDIEIGVVHVESSLKAIQPIASSEA